MRRRRWCTGRWPPRRNTPGRCSAARLGAEVWVKHENHRPTGAFKVRGGITFFDWLRRDAPDCPGIVTATRGNHGQSLAWPAPRRAAPVRSTCPAATSVEKNAAMRAFGAELVEIGADFDEARVEAFRVAARAGLHFVPPFHRELVRGVATYGLELFRAAPHLDAVYVPIGWVRASAAASRRATCWG